MKKIIFLFALFLISVPCFASNNDDVLNKVNSNYMIFKAKQDEYVIKQASLNEPEKELEFEKVYNVYINNLKDLYNYFYYDDEAGYHVLTDDYVTKYQKNYLKMGITFNVAEGQWQFEPDYTVLIKTQGIPENWKNWLLFQQRQEQEAIKASKKAMKNGYGSEGAIWGLDSVDAMIRLEHIEKQSYVISKIKAENYDYIPVTSKRLFDIYIRGNEYDHRFDYSGSGKLYPDAKKSFETFVATQKDSRYWQLVNTYLTKLANNNYKYSEELDEWLLNELEKL